MHTLNFHGDGSTISFKILDPVSAVASVSAVTVNGSAGPAVSGIAGATVTLASAPAVGSVVAITYLSQVVDHTF